MARQAVTVNRPVALDNYGGIVMVDDFFFYEDIAGSLHGVTGSTFRPVNQETYDLETSRDALLERFEDEEGGARMVRLAVESGEEDELAFDLSYAERHPVLRGAHETMRDAVVFDCTGGGRCFDAEDKGEYSVVLDETLLGLVREAEARDLTAEGFAAITARLRAHLESAPAPTEVHI